MGENWLCALGVNPYTHSLQGRGVDIYQQFSQLTVGLNLVLTAVAILQSPTLGKLSCCCLWPGSLPKPFFSCKILGVSRTVGPM